MLDLMRRFSADPGSVARLRVLTGAVLVQLILGTVYGYSIFWQPLNESLFPPVVLEAERAVLLQAGEDMVGYTFVADEAARQGVIIQQQSFLKYAFAICLLSFASVMVVAGRVQDVMGPRVPVIIGAALMGGGFLLAGLMNHMIVFYLAHAALTGVVAIVLLMANHALLGHLDREQVPAAQFVPMGILVACAVAGITLGQQYVGQLGELDRLFMLWGSIGFLAGAGIGFAYVCPIAALVKWFPRRKGLVTGLAVAGFGFGAFVFKDPAVGAEGYIRRHDILDFFIVHGLICLVGITLGAMLLSNPPAGAPGAPPMRQGAAGGDGELGWQRVLRRPAFYVIWMMFFSGATAGLMVIGIVKVFAGEQLVSAALEAGELTEAARQDLLNQGVTAVGWLAVFNALGRIAWGQISDLIGRTASLVAMFLLQAGIMFLLAGMRTELSLIVAASIIGFNFGGNFALFPSLTADLFGTKNLGANYGWVFTSYGIAGVVGVGVGNFAREQTGSYAAAFGFAAVLCLASAALAVGLHLAHRRVISK